MRIAYKGAMGVALVGASLMGLASPAAAQNFITNGDFEGGYTTVNGSNVPNGWTPNDAFLNDPAFAGVRDYNAYSGSYSLEIGNYDADPVDMISQTFADVVGGAYTATFYAFKTSGADSNAFLTVSAGGQSFSYTTANPNFGSYQLGTLTFTGSGSDTLNISAATDPGDWFIDNVSVTGPSYTPPIAAAAPEPTSWLMMIVGFGFVGAGMRLKRRHTALRYI